MEMVADRVVESRASGWEWEHDGERTRRCMSIAALGGATLDNEENYLIKKLLTGSGSSRSRTRHGLPQLYGRRAWHLVRPRRVEHAPGRPPECGPDCA